MKIQVRRGNGPAQNRIEKFAQKKPENHVSREEMPDDSVVYFFPIF